MPTAPPSNGEARRAAAIAALEGLDDEAADPNAPAAAIESRPGATRRGGSRLSLRGQALACLARRDYSRQELRTRLLRTQPRRRTTDRREAPRVEVEVEVEAEAEATRPPTEAEVDAVLDWLESRGYLSDERFVENRVQARAARHGTLRIKQELARHGVKMTPEQAAGLRETELARAKELWQRKFGALAAEPKERARQARYLSARGFPADIVRRVVGGDED